MKNKLLAYGIFEDNESFNKYVALIKANLKTTQEPFKTQIHHIIPRQFYKYTKTKLDDTAANKVNLLHKDHILAHYYLYLCSKDSYLRESNAIAVRLMVPELPLTMDEKIFIERLPYYAKLKEESLSSMAGESNPAKRPEVRQKISKALTGRAFSPEHIEKLKSYKKTDAHRKNISKAKKGKSSSDETRIKIGLALKGKLAGERHPQYGKPAFNRGVPCPEHVKKAVSAANKGKKPRLGAKLSEETKQLISLKAKQRPKRTWVHNEEVEHMIALTEKQLYIDKGFKPGRRPKNG